MTESDDDTPGDHTLSTSTDGLDARDTTNTGTSSTGGTTGGTGGTTTTTKGEASTGNPPKIAMGESIYLREPLLEDL